MSGLINKVKEALSPDKNTPETAAANRGNNGECCPSNSSSATANGNLDYGRNDGTGITGSHHNTGVDSRIDSGRGEF